MMRTTASIFLALASIVAVSGAGLAEPKPAPQTCQLLELASLDMTTLPTGEFTVPVTINDRTFPLLVDTGSTDTSISFETAGDLGLTRYWTNAGGAFINNVAISQIATVSELRMGHEQSRNGWVVFVIPDQMVPADVAGLLGPDFFVDDDVEIDFYRGKFNLFKNNTCNGHVVYWTKDPYAALSMTSSHDRHIKLEALLDGKEVTVVFDTGAPTSIMSLDTAKELFDWKDDDPRVRSVGNEAINGGATTPLYTFPFATLNFNGVVVYNPRIIMIPKKNFSQDRHDETTVVLGMSVLRQLHLYIDYPDKMVYLTGAEAK